MVCAPDIETESWHDFGVSQQALSETALGHISRVSEARLQCHEAGHLSLSCFGGQESKVVEAAVGQVTEPQWQNHSDTPADSASASPA